MKKTILLLLLINMISFSQIVKTGIDVLKGKNFDVLKNKRVGLVTNPTGVDQNLKSTVDILFEAQDVNLVALYGPEHGVRGDVTAGEKVDSGVDKKTGLPVFSLYGKTRKPNAEMLKGIDVLVYDIQDNGARSYTFISTMGLVMEAAAENDIEVVVLDRPNPLGGNRVEGNIAVKGYFSFVSQFPIPYIYGLTCGELAKYLNYNDLLENGKRCKLHVVEMEGWNRDMIFEETGLEWVPSSPHIPHKNSSFFYSATGVVGELGVISIGVGYTMPFQTFAAEWIDGAELANEMNSYNLEGVIFRPLSYKPYYAFGKGTYLGGVQIHIMDYKKVELLPLQFYFMQAIHKLYPDHNPFEMAKENRIKMFDKVCGNSKVRELFTKDFNADEVVKFFREEAEQFKQDSKKYYMY